MKRYNCTFFVVFSLLFLLTTGFVMVTDPFQIYGAHTGDVKFSPNQRFQNAGLINSYHFDAVIIGSSMSENFIPSEITNLFDFDNTMKLVASGASAKEQRIILQKAIDQHRGELKAVILDLNPSAYRGGIHRMRDEFFPEYLYDDILLNDLRYIINSKTLESSLKRIKSVSNWESDLDRLNYVGDHKTGMSEVIESTFKRARLSIKEYSLRNLIDNFNINIFPIIRDNPSITFKVFIPPYHTIAYALFRKESQKVFENLMILRRHQLKQLSSLNHVQVFTFDHEYWITDDYNNYRDIGHYSGDINRHMMIAMFEENVLNLVVGDKVDNNIENLVKHVNRFVIPSEAKLF